MSDEVESRTSNTEDDAAPNCTEATMEEVTSDSIDDVLKAQIAEADVLLINSPIAPGLSAQVRSIIREKASLKTKVVVVLVSSGGVADDAYRTAMAIRDHYENVSVCIAGWCKSAGTLLAISANELIFSCDGEMGPLDVQIAVKDEIIDSRDSGLIIDSAIRGMTDNAFGVFEKFMTSIIKNSQGAITFRTAADLAADITIGLMSPVYDKIDPLRIGADQRAQNIGMHYAIRLNMISDNLHGPEALNMLLNGYPSHGFVIDFEEAARLFTNVKPLDGYLKLIVEGLGPLARFPGDEPVVCFLNGEEDEQDEISSTAETGEPDAAHSGAENMDEKSVAEEL